MKKLYYAGQENFTSELMPAPIPASKDVPGWFKDIPKTTESKLGKSDSFTYINANSCMPFLDSFTSGYLIRLHCDVYVAPVEGYPARLSWNPVENNAEAFQPIKQRPAEVHGSYLATPAGCEPHAFDWLIKWNFKAPKGYSLLMTHPFNRNELPFISATAIMDADDWGLAGTHSFWLKEGFEGLIPAGTPIVQVLPILREDWELEEDKSLTREAKALDIKKQFKFTGYYRDHYWKKKSYK